MNIARFRNTIDFPNDIAQIFRKTTKLISLMFGVQYWYFHLGGHFIERKLNIYSMPMYTYRKRPTRVYNIFGEKHVR